MQKGILLIFCLVLAIHLKATDTCKAMIQANFDVQDVCLGEESVFNNTSASDPLESFYTWKFGDGDVANQRHPKHTYKDAQFYVVSLKVTLKNGCTDSIVKVLEVIPLPFCAFTVSVDYKQNQQRTVQATPKSGVKPTYKWTYLYNQTSNDQILNFAFPVDSVAKNFKAEKIVLQVTNQQGCSSRDSINTIFVRTPENGIKSILNNNTDLNFANPSSGQLSIYNKGNDYTYQLIDITGQLIKSGVLTKGQTRIEIDQTGIFFLKSIDIHGQYFVNKIIVQ
jgi:PKD repeat protein